MCGRFASKGSAREIAKQLGVEEIALPEEYNIAPTQYASAIVADPDPRWTLLRWGLIPPWAKDIDIGQKLINARSETIMEKPSYRSAFKRRRCLIPSLGYYEWLRQGKSKQPYFNTFLDDRLLVMAGIWEHWQSPEGTELETFSVLTTQASPMVSHIHNRMPIILERDEWAIWLDHSSEKVHDQISLMRPYLDDQFHCYKVSMEVNSVRNNHSKLIEPLNDTPDLFPGF